jgi:MFS family permease
MVNGLNALPSYSDYFHLNAATLGLNTASVFIGGILGPLISGVMSDRLGRRPTIFYGSASALIGVILQTAAQDIAMFVVARIILGFGIAVSGIAAGVYLSETFASRYRAWGVGILNDFYYVGALIAAGITLGTSTYVSQAQLSSICVKQKRDLTGLLRKAHGHGERLRLSKDCSACCA